MGRAFANSLHPKSAQPERQSCGQPAPLQSMPLCKYPPIAQQAWSLRLLDMERDCSLSYRHGSDSYSTTIFRIRAQRSQAIDTKTTLRHKSYEVMEAKLKVFGLCLILCGWEYSEHANLPVLGVLTRSGQKRRKWQDHTIERWLHY